MDLQLLIQIKDVTDEAHAQVNQKMSSIKKACQKGCNSCCHQIVDVVTWEEPKIFEYIDNNFDRKMKNELAKNLNRWFKIFNNATRYADKNNPLSFAEVRDVQHLFREKKVACPFLMGSSCSIYKARPLVCRVHYEKDSAENCRKDPHLTTPVDAQEIFHNVVTKFDPNVFFVATKPLAYLVAEEFGKDIQSKPLAGVIYDPNNMFNLI